MTEKEIIDKNTAMLEISDFNKSEFEELKDFLSDKKQCKALIFMFNNIDRFLFFTSQGNRICVHYNTNGFNGFTKENPHYLSNKKRISFTEFKNIFKT